MTDSVASGVVEHATPLGFEAVVERLAKAVTEAGMTVFARIDHAAGARKAGLAMPPATVILYGHAKGGTPIMLASPLAALDLPLRVLVREREDGQVVIAFHPVAQMLAQAGVPADLAARLEPAQRLLMKAVTG
jgi:uncharacterized protein (DUF302 family)